MEWPKTFNELTGIKNPTIVYEYGGSKLFALYFQQQRPKFHNHIKLYLFSVQTTEYNL